jgi:hypothetical protein
MLSGEAEIAILGSLFRPDWGLNPQSIAIQMSKLIITPPRYTNGNHVC